MGESLPEAEQARREIQALARRGIRLPPQSEPLSTLVDAWLKKLSRQVQLGTLSDRTLTRYREVIRAQIEPYLGKQLVRSIDRFTVASFLENLGRSQLSPKTQQLVLKTLSRLMDYAVERHVHGYNPVKEFASHEAQTAAPSSAAGLSAPRVFSQEELARLLDAAFENWRLALHCMALTGLRTAEVLALQWRDIGERSLSVRHQLRRDGGLEPLPSGSPRRREIVLAPAQREAFSNERRATPFPADEDLVFPSRGGSPRSVRSLDLAFRKAVNRAGLDEKLTAACLRHTFAAGLIATGVDCGVIARQLGYSSFESTYRAYSAFFAQAGRLDEARAERRAARRAGGESPPPAQALTPQQRH
jgi:integrase